MSVRLKNPATLAEAKGFSHVAVGKGAPVVLAGQIGWDKAGKVVSEDLVAQFALALDNLVEALRAAGGKPADLALLRIYCTRVPEYRARLKELGDAYRKRLGRHFPAMCLLGVTELFTPGTWIEIEGLAYVEAEGAPGA
ncbi:MAG TPA: RidA family protein [Planctomycetota bacterium]|nr:RidA family protein [Planctomycetota bacterium]